MDLDLMVSDDSATTPLNDTAPDSTLDASPESPSSPFEAVPADLRPALEQRGFSSLTDVQSAVLAASVGGRDLQISSQTGSGKTVALGFVLAPALAGGPSEEGPDALIIVPTRELANQVCEELSWLLAGLDRVDVTSVTGGTPVFRDRQALRRRPRVLVGTPGRLLDHVKSGALQLGGVRELVLDEADQMLDMGFREELEGILDTTPETRRTHLVSATFPDGIQRLTARYQRDPLTIEGTRLGDANGNIEHIGHMVQRQDRYSTLVNLLLQADGERTLVFVERRADALEVSTRLEADGFAALPLSGELVQSQRERTLAAFRAGRATVLVATDVAARGLDVPDVVSVIHTAPPIDAQVYTHRSGRTGRAGKMGRSILLAPRNRRRKVERLMAEAAVNLRWAPAPDADEVRSELAARARTALERDLDAALTEGPSPAHVAHAEELLAGRPAPALVAALLARLEPTRSTEPRSLEDPQAPDDRRSSDRSARPERHGRPERNQRPDRRGPFGKPTGRPASNGGWKQAGPGRPGARAPQTGIGDSVRFFMNWGVNQGANPGRVLAAVCRRGKVEGADIGSIAVHPNASTFDVRAEIAEQFERLAGRRDPRDSRTRIRRDRGPAPSRSAGPAARH